MYIYPDNLTSKAMLWLWKLKDIGIIEDIGIIGVGLLFSVLAITQTGITIPPTRQLMGIESIKDYCIATRMGDLVFFIIKPTNISVLPDSSISARGSMLC